MKRGDFTQAGEWFGRYRDSAAPLVEEARADGRMLGELAQCHVLAGRMAAAVQQPAVARDHWQRTIDLVGRQTTALND